MSLKDGEGDVFPEEDTKLPLRKTLLRGGGEKFTFQKPVKDDSNTNNRVACLYPHLVYRLDFISNVSFNADSWQGTTKYRIIENIAVLSKKKDTVHWDSSE